MGLVLLIACANVANLLLARSMVRTREFAIRAALGASGARLAWQLIAEGVLLSLSGGALGLAIAQWGASPALASPVKSLPRSQSLTVNTTVLLFTFSVSLAVGIFFGLAPALKSSNRDLQSSLKAGGRGFSGGGQRAQHLLVIVQMALTLVLLTGAGLLLRTMHNLWNVNPGFATQHILTFKVGISPSLTQSPETTRVAFQQLTERVRRIPGIEDADVTAMLPLNQQGNSGPFLIGSQAPSYVAEAPRALYYWTGPDYLRTLKIPLLRGRFFTVRG